MTKIKIIFKIQCL